MAALRREKEDKLQSTTLVSDERRAQSEETAASSSPPSTTPMTTVAGTSDMSDATVMDVDSDLERARQSRQEMILARKLQRQFEQAEKARELAVQRQKVRVENGVARRLS